MPPLAELSLDPEVADAVTTSLWSHAYTVGGVLLALFALARLATERRQPSNTLAWLMGIVLIPYVGVPLFLLLGGRKIRRLAARKRRIRLPAPASARASAATLSHPVAQTICTSGSGEPVGGNSVRLFTSGEETFAELERQILSARHSIHIATFILGRDKVGRRIVELLAKRAREGVKVRLQLDALGCFFSSRGFVDPLREAGGEVVRFLPVVPLSSRGSANLRNHRKIAVFDRHTAFIGGHNLARDYLGPRTRAELLDEIFLADWAFATGRPLEQLHRELETDPPPPGLPGAEPTDSEVQIVASGPDIPGDPLYEGMLSMIQEARQSIWIVTPYFLPDEVLLRSLVVKARAGHDVTIVLPERSNHPVTDLARRPHLRQLVRAGARVLAYRPRMLHAKALVVDERIGLVGSANLDMRSLFVNFEVGMVLHGERDAQALRAWAGELARDCRPLGLADLKRRKFPANLIEDLSRLLSPLL